MADHIVVGGGHIGLVTACYLARAGRDVLVLEQSAKLGGGSRTDELVPGYRFNTHSAAHNIINATGIVEELGLRAVGLEYREMGPFSIAVHGDGAIVRRRLPAHWAVRVTGVELESDEYIHTSCVITAMDPKIALLELLDPPLSGIGGAALGATHRSNAVQMLVLLATTALPGYAHGQPGDWNGLQSYVDTLDSLADGFAQAEARRLRLSLHHCGACGPHPPGHG